MIKFNAGTYFGQVSKSKNFNESQEIICSCCGESVSLGEEYYTHEQLELDFCSPNCLTKEVNKLMLKVA